MTDDFKKDNDNIDDIDGFFEEFDKISSDYKKKSTKPEKKVEGIPSDVAASAFSEEKIVADRSKRYSKKKDTVKKDSIRKDPVKKNTIEKNEAVEEDIKDIDDLLSDEALNAPAAESGEDGGFSAMAQKVKDNLKNISKKTGKKIKKLKTRKRKTGKSSSNLKKRRRKKKGKKVWLKRILAACGILVVAGIIFVAFVLQDTQKINYNNIYEYLAEASVIYDDDGKEIDSIYSGEGSRVIVDYDDMPKDLVNAFVSIEDKTFWKHHGFNPVRMIGAVWDSVTGGGRVGGTSTITQQLARNLWLTETKSSRGFSGVIRKIKEAYYTVQLERHLTKEQIIEAYLNTIALGQNSLGVQSAAQTYYSKDVQDLTLLESAALASLPQAPGRYSYIKTVDKGEVSKDDPRIIQKGKVNTYLYNDEAEWRVQLVLDFMEEQGYIDSSKHDKAKVSKLKKKINPNLEDQSDEAQFFIDYTIKNLTKDLMKEYNYSEKDATQMIYSGGLKIYTTLDKTMQNAIEEEFKNSSNFPGVTNLNTDSEGNIRGEGGSVVLYSEDNYFNDDGEFTIKGNEFTLKSNGDIVLKKGKRLNFYEVENNGADDINIEFKDLYTREDGAFYSINGGVISIPAKYKKMDSKGNVVIDAKFMKDKPEFMEVSKSKIIVPDASYTLRQQVRQPQSSMVILDHSNGQLKAMVGGRNIEGKMNYNRSTSPRQPGSSIKPIGAYGPAIETGAQGQKITNGESSFGSYWTSASVINDEEMKNNGKIWPKNWYSGYKGPMTLRKAVEQSVNTTAVKVLNNIGPEKSAAFLKKLGVTTVVEEGATSDMNPAALALGGMTKGISPLQMASAYGTFANKGVHVEPTSYTVIKNREDKIVLESSPKKNRAMNAGTAFIMTDILKTVVSDGIGNAASISGHTVAGKTGTTTDNFDAWFVGMTGQYAASLWIGNDVNIELSEGSGAAARLWSKIMSQALENEESKSFPSQPSNVTRHTVSGISDYFIDGTVPSSLDLSKKTVKICVDSGYLGTPWCPTVKEKSFTSLYTGGDEESGSAPKYYCNLHNLDPKQFPIDPKKKVDKNFKDPNAKEEEKKKPEPVQPTNPTEPEQPVQPTNPTGSGVQGMRTQSTLHYHGLETPLYDRLYSLNRFYDSNLLAGILDFDQAS